MTTVYIDVYFFINMTVDILSAYFAAGAVNIRSSVPRLAFIGAIGGGLAVFDVVFNFSAPVRIGSFFIYMIVSGWLISKIGLTVRRIKFAFAFFFFEIFVGGGVYYGYLILERYFGDFLSPGENTGTRREIIILSVLILFVIGVLKLLVLIFGKERFIKTVRLKIEIDGKVLEADALVDSGNLVRDPMNMCPVLFVKNALAKKLFPINVTELTDIDSLGGGYRKRIRLIPVTRNGTTHVMTGVRMDRVTAVLPKGEEEISVTLAIDKEEGSFGGYDALLPSAVIEDGI